jgi:hypothetical protein
MGNGVRTCHNVMAMPFAFIMSWPEDTNFFMLFW